MTRSSAHTEFAPDVPAPETDELVITDDEVGEPIPDLTDRPLEADAADVLDQRRAVDDTEPDDA